MRTERTDQARAAMIRFACAIGIPEDVILGLLERFCSVTALVEAGEESLMQAEPRLKQPQAMLIARLPELVRHMDRARLGEHPRIPDLGCAGRFLRVRFLGMRVEQFRLLLLDRNARLIEDRMMQSGDEDSASFYPKHVLAAAVSAKASYLILCHNHPNGTMCASQADVECTRVIMTSLRTVGVPLLDHLILADGHTVSIRASGLIRERAWLDRHAEDPVLRDWLGSGGKVGE